MTRRHTPVSPMTGDEVDGILRNIETLLLEREATRGEEPAGVSAAPLFVPSLCDIPVKDGVGLMDVAVFRLSKSQERKESIIRYELSDAVIEVSGGAHGMATVYDYDIVLLTITYLASQVRRYREGKCDRPSSRIVLSGTDILKFCRLPQGGKQYAGIEEAIARLQGTFVKITRKKGGSTRRVGYFPLIAGAEVQSRTDTGRVGVVALQIPDWIYAGVMNHRTPEILTLNRDYFLIDSGLARFVYRLARKAAGAGEATFYLRTLHERSGSTRAFKKFAFDVRALAARDDLPDYRVRVVAGPEGEMLRMSRRGSDSDPLADVVLPGCEPPDEGTV